MKKINDMIHGTQMLCVMLLSLLGSVEEYVIPVIATLCGLLALDFIFLVFLVRARKRMLVNRAIDKMEMAARNKVFEYYKSEDIA